MTQTSETLVRQLIERGFSQGDLGVVDEVISPEMVEHQNFGRNHPSGVEGVKAVIASLRGSFSDFRLRIEDLVIADETVWVRMTGTGTNDGSFLGNPPTGRDMRIDVFDAFRVVDNRIVEHWGVPDRLGVLFQLGLAQLGSRAPESAPAWSRGTLVAVP